MSKKIKWSKNNDKTNFKNERQIIRQQEKEKKVKDIRESNSNNIMNKSIIIKAKRKLV